MRPSETQGSNLWSWKIDPRIPRARSQPDLTPLGAESVFSVGLERVLWLKSLDLILIFEMQLPMLTAPCGALLWWSLHNLRQSLLYALRYQRLMCSAALQQQSQEKLIENTGALTRTICHNKRTAGCTFRQLVKVGQPSTSETINERPLIYSFFLS
jgi:hypothetical protein